MQIERGPRGSAPDLAAAGDGRDDALAQNRRRERQAGDGEPVEIESHRKMRDAEVFGERRRGRCRRPRHIDLGDPEPADVQLTGNEIGRNEIEVYCVQGQIDAARVGDGDALDFEMERQEPA